MKSVEVIFGEKLKLLREENLLSQRALSKQIGYSQAAIARWEAGLTIPNIQVLLDFAKFFNVSTDYLLNEKF